jgi:hypothetical protein
MAGILMSWLLEGLMLAAWYGARSTDDILFFGRGAIMLSNPNPKRDRPRDREALAKLEQLSTVSEGMPVR